MAVAQICGRPAVLSRNKHVKLTNMIACDSVSEECVYQDDTAQTRITIIEDQQVQALLTNPTLFRR